MLIADVYQDAVTPKLRVTQIRDVVIFFKQNILSRARSETHIV